jgi:hypothetical protein
MQRAHGRNEADGSTTLLDFADRRSRFVDSRQDFHGEFSSTQGVDLQMTSNRAVLYDRPWIMQNASSLASGLW